MPNEKTTPFKIWECRAGPIHNTGVNISPTHQFISHPVRVNQEVHHCWLKRQEGKQCKNKSNNNDD